MRPLKSNVASAILGRNWVTRATGLCAQISTGSYIWLLRQRKIYYSFWRIKIRCYNKAIYCTKHVSLHTNQSRSYNTVLWVMSSYQLLHTEVIHHDSERGFEINYIKAPIIVWMCIQRVNCDLNLSQCLCIDKNC